MNTRLHRPRQWLRTSAESAGLLLVLLGLWWLASHEQWISKVFLPTPESMWASLAQGLGLDGGNAELLGYAASTVGRMLMGWLLAGLLGVALGVWVGVSARARRWLLPTLEFLRPLPASAVLPLAISIFGLSGGMVLFVVAFGAMWPVMLGTIHGLVHVEPRLRDVAAALQLGRLDYVCKIGLPGALPDILAGLRLALTVSLIVAVVGEMLASQSGLGQAILLAARSFRASDLFAGIAMLGAIGFVSNAALAGLERHGLKWQQR